MAFRAAMTGHQVYSTLHTNSAIGAIPRLHRHRRAPRHHGRQHHRHDRAAPGAQALHALPRSPTTPTPADAQPARHGRVRRAGHALPRGGLRPCDYQGYRGRLAIMEILKLDAEIDELIARRATAREIRSRRPRAKGFRTLADDAHCAGVLDGPRRALEEIIAGGRPDRPRHRNAAHAVAALFALHRARIVQGDRRARQVVLGPASTPSTSIDLELRLQRMGLDLDHRRAVKRSAPRSVAARHAPGADHLLLPPGAAAARRRAASSRPHRPARHRRQPGFREVWRA